MAIIATPSTPSRVPIAVNGTAAVISASAEVWTITVEMARELLANAHPNRHVSHVRVKSIARAIKAGRWRMNGESIILCPDHRLLDGRHRLLACIEANQSITALVVVGVDPRTFPTMDQGGKRSGGDVLSIAGHPQAKPLASALKWTWRYEFEHMRSQKVGILDYELDEYLSQHSALPASLPQGHAARALLPVGIGAMLHYHMAALDNETATTFFTGLAQGQQLTSADPVWHVRERFLKDKSPLHHNAILGRGALTVLAWNCIRKGQPFPAGLTWKGLSDKGVNFPQVL